MRLRHGWRIARLPEENYQVASLGELLAQVVARSDQSADQTFIGVGNDLELQERTLDVLHHALVTSRKPLLVILENLTSLFDRQLRSIKDQARFRDILTNNPAFILMATSTSQPDATTKHSAPLFEFFQTVVLDDLNRADITELVRARAGWERNTSLLADFARVKGRIDAIYHLSGGNPRLALALYRAIEHGVTSELHEHIMKLLDEVTPYYQARLNDIPPQAVRVLTEMAVSERLATPAVIARRCRIPTNQVTAQINKLLDERLVIHGGRPDARSRFYEFKDRLLRIWIQMRESVGAARRLRFLAEFFERWYAGRSDELEEASRRTVSDFWTDLAGGDERRCGDRLKTLSYLSDIRPGFDQSVVLRAMSAQVGGSSEADVRSHTEALQRTFDAATDLREREALAFLLARCYLALNLEQDGRRYLRSVLEEGSQSEAIAGHYVSALVADRSFDKAWEFGRDWLLHHRGHVSVTGDVGVAACGIREFGKGLELIEQYTRAGFCSHCVEKVLRKAILTLRGQQAPTQIEREFWQRTIASDSTGNAEEPEVQAVLDVLAAARLSEIPDGTLVTAGQAWKPLSAAPMWFLGKGICGLAHRVSRSMDTLRFISALADRSPSPLGQFAIDHLIEILSELRHNSHANDLAAQAYSDAMTLVRQRTTQESLGTAIRFSAPVVAQKSPELVRDLIALYQELLQQGLLAEAITPYSETLAVLGAPDAVKMLQSLHPETRDAVSLLLVALGQSERTVDKSKDGEQSRLAKGTPRKRRSRVK
jgi:hypothetical protein